MHQEPVIARSEIGEVDGALFGRRAPIRVSTFQFVLVTQNLARCKAQAHEIDLHLVLVWGKLRQRHFCFPEGRNALR